MISPKQHLTVAPNRAFALLAVLIVLTLVPCFADVKKLRINKETPEGQFLELVSLETDAQRKVALLEQFLVLFPNSEPVGWVYSELQDRYRRAGNLDNALAMGEKVLALEPDNLETARLNWRIAETKGDAELVKQWAAATAKIAEHVVKIALPSDPEDNKAAQERIAYARQFIVNTDHDDYMKARQVKDPAGRIAALEEFVKKSPQNPYMDQIEIVEFLAWREIGNVEKTLAAAEKIIAHNDTRDDALLFVAEINFRRKKDPRRVVALATKFIERISVAEKPDGMTDQEWTRAKNQNLALAHFMIGSIHFQSEQWPSADRALRAALPFIGDDQLRVSVLNSLGWANYKMKDAIEAIKFYRMCAAIPSPLQEQASQSVVSIKAEYNLP